MCLCVCVFVCFAGLDSARPEGQPADLVCFLLSLQKGPAYMTVYMRSMSTVPRLAR